MKMGIDCVSPSECKHPYCSCKVKKVKTPKWLKLLAILVMLELSISAVMIDQGIILTADMCQGVLS